MRISISDAFDGGNITHVKTEGNNVYLCVKPDPYTVLEKKHHLQYFAFRTTINPTAAATTTTINFILENANKCSYPSAWPGTTVCTSTDLVSWSRVVNTTYDQEKGNLIWSYTLPATTTTTTGGSVYFAYYPLYSHERHLSFLAKAAESEGARVRSLGQTLDGRELDCVSVGTGATQVWIIHRQHPGENMAEFFAEGLINRLLGCDSEGSIDGLARSARLACTFHIVPCMCPDGAVRGHLRTNASGANLNREWRTTGEYEAPTLERSPEVYHVLAGMKETGVDLFADIHGDEELPFNFISGMEGIPNWGDRLQSLQGAFLASYCRANSDMQQKVSYDPGEPNEGLLNVASNHVANTFDCLGVTLEMPFKDCYTNPDPTRGWSPDRCRQLGASILDPIMYVQPYLRESNVNLETFPEADAYVRPSETYE